MRHTDKPRTLFAVRIRDGKLQIYKDLLHLFYILGVFGLLFGVIGGAQIWHCRTKDPDASITDCLRGYSIKEKR